MSGDIGWVFVACSVFMSAVSPLGGYLGDRLGRGFPAVGGTLLLLAGAGLLFEVRSDTSLVALGAYLAVGADGIGLQMGAQQAAALDSAPGEMAGSTGGIWATSRYFGSITASVVLAVVVGERLDPAGFRIVLYVIVAAGLILLPVSTLLQFSGRPLGLLAAHDRQVERK